MKKINLLFLIILTTVFFACKKDESGNVQPVSVDLQVSMDNALSSYNFPLSNIEIKLTNLTNGQVNTAKTDASGKINFGSIIPGNYDVQAVLNIPAADYSTITGTASAGDVVFNGLLKATTINVNTKQLAITIKAGRIGDWVFKQIYYAGSSTSSGASFRDCFVELYNNSNEVLYADSLYFAQVFGINTRSSAIDYSKNYFRSNGQFDWGKSIGNTISKANEDYIYTKNLFMIPGSGKQYPVQPGTSIIIASTAINHKAPFTGADGVSVTVKDPSLTVDLSKADFEVNLNGVVGINPLSSDIDNPAVPNMTVVSAADRDLIFQAGGRDAFAIFKTSDVVTSYGKYPSPDVVTITASTDLYYRVPSKHIIDAVETQPPVAANQFPKKLENILDASYTFVSKGQYNSQSLIRKTAKTVGSRRILQDTNNSNTDFSELERADASKTAFK
ncbi:MAG: DUF4876 domain-containing protein [Flavobacterium sp.]|nr:MAG: DUF4876 domain-containing protein [Flavobacterium sp.]